MKSAARWAEGESVNVDGEMTVRSSETGKVSVMVGQGRSEARECCSEQRTPGGGTTPTPLWLLLKKNDGTRERNVNPCVIFNAGKTVLVIHSFSFEPFRISQIS